MTTHPYNTNKIFTSTKKFSIFADVDPGKMWSFYNMRNTLKALFLIKGANFV